MGVVGRQRELEQEFRERSARDTTPGGRPEDDLAGAASDVPEGGQVIAHAAGQDHDEFRPPAGCRRDRVPPVRRERAARRRPAGRPPRRARHRRSNRAAGWTSPADRSARCSRPRSASRCATRSRRVARGPVATRRRPPACAADGSATSSRGRSTAPPWRRSRAAASAGSASAARSPRTAMIASTSAPAGIVMDPTSRQRPPTRPIIAAATVAAPVSRARKARGSLVTCPCYPARRATGSGGAPSGSLRRPRRSRRPTPRAGR